MLTACFCLNKRLPKEGVAELFVENMTSQKRFEGKCLPDNYMDGFDEEMEEYAPTQTTVEIFSFEVRNVDKLTKFYFVSFFTDPSYESSPNLLLFARGTVNRHACSDSVFVRMHYIIICAPVRACTLRTIQISLSLVFPSLVSLFLTVPPRSCLNIISNGLSKCNIISY